MSFFALLTVFGICLGSCQMVYTEDTGSLASPDRNKLYQKCNASLTLAHGKVQKSFGADEKDILTFTCDTGYLLSGKTVLTCEDGRLSGEAPKCLARDCLAHYQAGHKVSGIYGISLDGNETVFVYCDMETAGGGWTVIQRRKDNSMSFNHIWQEYKQGFGHLHGNFWLGLENIHLLTGPESKLMVTIISDSTEQPKRHTYDWFHVEAEEQQYKIRVGGHKGDGSDGLNFQNNMKFSSIDRDYDIHKKEHCAKTRNSAWWYKDCDVSDLNRMVCNIQTTECPGLEWIGYKTITYAEMTVKRITIK